MTEEKAIYRAGKAVGRLDQLLTNRETSTLVEPWFNRTEALHISAAEKRKADPTRLAALIEDASTFDIIDSADRTALDLYKALSLSRRWTSDGPTGEQVKHLWEVADASNTKRRDENREWRVERDSSTIADEIQILMATPSPWTAAEAVRRIWTSGTMEGSSRRMALLLGNHIVRVGFASPNALVGVTHGLHQDVDNMLVAVEDKGNFTPLFFEAVAISAERTFDAALKLARLCEEFTVRCKPERATAKTPQAVRLLLSHPVLTAPFVAERIGISMRGAYSVLDRLEEAGCISRMANGSSKNTTYLCSKALTA